VLQKLRTISGVMAVFLMLGQLTLVAAPSAQASSLSVLRLAISNHSPEINVKVVMKACWSNSSSVVDIRLESRPKNGRVWTEIQQKNGVNVPSGCAKWKITSSSSGEFYFQARETVGRRVVAKSKLSLVTFEPVPIATLSSSSLAPETGANVQMTTCWHKSFGIANAKLEVTVGTLHVWKVTNQRIGIPTSGCVSWNILAGPIGLNSYRIILTGHGVTTSISNVINLTTFGPISVATLINSEFGSYNCNGNGTVSNGTNIYPTFCRLYGGSATSPNVTTFSQPTTCRSMTLSVMGTNNSSGNAADTNVDTFEVIQSSLNPQTFTFPANQVQTFTVNLDGSKGAIQTWSGTYDTFERFYLLSSAGSMADCSSLSGV